MALPDNVTVGVAIPQHFPGGKVDMGHVRRFAERAEELDYHSIWVMEQILGTAPILEPVSLLGYLSGVTSKVKLGSSVIVLTFRNPIAFAKSMSAIDLMSGGRLIVGVGTATLRHNPPFRPQAERRVQKFIETVEMMKALWTEPVTNYQGEIWQLEGASMEPKPIQRPHPPVWFGGRSPATLKRAVQHADGWMEDSRSTAAEFKEEAALIRRSLEEAGRDPASFTISKRLTVVVDNDAENARRQVEDWYTNHYTNPAPAANAIVGTLEHCRERVEAYVDAGAGHLIITVLLNQVEQLSALAEVVGKGK
jgi:probable F420-dependent oxidoreductase